MVNESQKEKAKENSNKALDYIRYKETYRMLNGTDEIYQHCLNFSSDKTIDKNSIINVKIARDIDKFENLIQLHIYVVLYPILNTKNEFDMFKKNLCDSIHTEFIKSLKDDFLKWVETDTIKKLFDLDSSNMPFRDNNLLPSERKIIPPSKGSSRR